MSFSGVTDPQLMAQASLLTGLPQLHASYTQVQSSEPASSAPLSGKPRQRQVPIARHSAASGYEKPERARTSHACEPCRERKTKCDGERPACRRCLHNGTTCHYGYGKGWKKRKTVEDLTVTSRKLACYENLLVEILPLVPENVRNMIEDARAQEFDPVCTSDGQEQQQQPPLSSDQLYHPEFHTGALGMARMAPSLPLPPPLPNSQSQSTASPFTSTPRSLPPPSHTEPIGSPLYNGPNSQRLSRSPEDPNLNPALRLPSITRTGMLVGEGPSTQQQTHTTPVTLPGQSSQPDSVAKFESNT